MRKLGVTAAACAAGDACSQINAIANGKQDGYKPLQTLGAAGVGFATSVIGSAAGNIAGGDKVAQGKSLISAGKDKLLTGVARQSVGQSHSTLIRSGTKMVAKGIAKRNFGRGITSVVATLATSRLNALWVSLK